ncbi:MAG: hypothetical protein S0880_08485 [Actinomycetota bacterium]|nr:hypothetical protein [Actinomycetota bacterium]
MRSWLAPIGSAALFALGLLVGALAVEIVPAGTAPAPGEGLGAALADEIAYEPGPRDASVYEGLGTWVDAFDFAPAYSGGEPSVTVDDLEEMAALGVRTLYLQVSRDDDRAEGLILDTELVSRFLLRAHRHGIAVVGWYLPRFGDVGRDLEHLEAVDTFEVAGHRFDGVGIDIEWTGDVEDPIERGARLVELTERYDEIATVDAIGGIVLPPVLLEVVNDQFWPSFPWAELEPLIDVWLPMSYWTDRRSDSGYRDGFTYNEESTRRLRRNVGNPDAVVHGIGGIGDAVDAAQLGDFAESLAATDSIGGSIYDWNTLDDSARRALRDLFVSGPAADLPSS